MLVPFISLFFFCETTLADRCVHTYVRAQKDDDKKKTTRLRSSNQVSLANLLLRHRTCTTPKDKYTHTLTKCMHVVLACAVAAADDKIFLAQSRAVNGSILREREGIFSTG